MAEALLHFEQVVRRSTGGSQKPEDQDELHPFDKRNIHPEISRVSMNLFNDGHYSQATFEGFKYIDKKVKKLSGLSKTGVSLMLDAFKEQNPNIQLNDLSDESERDEQKGFSFLFAGSSSAIRNPRGHEVGNLDTVDRCLDHLSLASFLLRTLDERVAP